MKVPNWQHNSKKQKKTKGTCKGVIKSRKQVPQITQVEVKCQMKREELVEKYAT